jgi:hypothetical protein
MQVLGVDAREIFSICQQLDDLTQEERIAVRHVSEGLRKLGPERAAVLRRDEVFDLWGFEACEQDAFASGLASKGAEGIGKWMSPAHLYVAVRAQQ